MENMELYNKIRSVPKEAQKAISAGRLKGMTDINPMWRIQRLTEQFGPCGTGWKYIIRDRWIEEGPNHEKAAFVDIDLYYKMDGEWSEPIPGTGGASFVAQEKSGLHLSDECFKMALTDALSVACKALGMGADVYWSAGRTKYDTEKADTSGREGSGSKAPICCADCKTEITDSRKRDGSKWPANDIAAYSKKYFGRCLCPDCQRRAYKEQQGDAK